MSGTVSVKLLDGATKFHQFCICILCGLICGTYFLQKKIEISVAYAVWSGVGTVLIALIGILYYEEPPTMLKISIFLIIAGAVSLNSAAIPNNASRRNCQRHLGTSQIILWRKAPAYQQ